VTDSLAPRGRGDAGAGAERGGGRRVQAGRLACAQRYRLVVGPGLAGCRWSAREEDGCIGVTRVRLLARVVRTEGGQRVRPFIV
jgi:hypothetical protein